MNAYAVAKLHLSNSLCSCHEFKNLLLSSLVCTEVSSVSKHGVMVCFCTGFLNA